MRFMNSGGREAERENDIPGRENTKSKVMASQKYSLLGGCQGNLLHSYKRGCTGEIS